MGLGNFADLLLFILGLVFGSFYAALSYRLPKEISIFGGRSFCDSCRHKIAWYDNIPLLSFVILMGKCRSCKKSVSLRYPSIEFITATGFLIIYRNFGSNFVDLSYFLLIFSVLVMIFIIDFEKRIIPDSIVFFGILISFLYLLIKPEPSLLLSGLFSGFGTASLLLVIHLLTHGRGMGLGDVKFAVLGGMIVGLKFSLLWLFMAFLTGGVVGSILILRGKAGLKSQIAFGPFLVLGVLLVFLYGDKVSRFMGLL